MKTFPQSFIDSLSKPSTAIVTIMRIDIDGTDANDIWLSNLPVVGASVPVYRWLSGTMPGNDVKFDEQKSNMEVGGIQFDVDDYNGLASILFASKVGAQNWYKREVTQYLTTDELGWSGKQIHSKYVIKEPPNFNGMFYKIFCYDKFHLIKQPIEQDEQRFELLDNVPWTEMNSILIKDAVVKQRYLYSTLNSLVNGNFEYRVGTVHDPSYGWTLTYDGGTTYAAAPPTLVLVERTSAQSTFEATISSPPPYLQKLEVYSKVGGTTLDGEATGWRLCEVIDIKRKFDGGWGDSDPFRFTIPHNNVGEDLAVACRFVGPGETPYSWSDIVSTGTMAPSTEVLSTMWANTTAATISGGQVEFSGTTFGGRMLSPLPKYSGGFKLALSLSVIAGVKIGICEYNGSSAEGKNGYLLKFNSATEVALYGVNASGTETIIGSARTVPTIATSTPFLFEMGIHNNQIIVLLGTTILMWEDTTYRVNGWYLHIKYSEAGSSTATIAALNVTTGSGMYQNLASSDVLGTFEDSADGLLKVEQARVDISSTKANLATFFQLISSTVLLKSSKMFASALASQTDLPALADVALGQMYIVKESLKSGLYIVGDDGSGNKEWWKLTFSVPSFTPAGGAPGDGDVGGGGSCFTEEMLLWTPDGHLTFEEVKVNDKILTCDVNTGRTVLDEVLSKQEHEVDEYLLVNEWLGVTKEHFLYMGGNALPGQCQQISAGALAPGIELYGVSGVETVGVLEVVAGKRKVYSIKTKNKNYWVTDGVHYILAHNAKNLDP